MVVDEVLMKYCDFVPGTGFVLKENAPEEALEIYEMWKKSNSGEPDENGVCTFVD